MGECTRIAGVVALNHRRHVRAESVDHCPLFDDENLAMLGENGGERHFVVRLEVAAVHHGDVESFSAGGASAAASDVFHHRAHGEDGERAAAPHHDFEGPMWRPQRCHFMSRHRRWHHVARVAQTEWPTLVLDASAQEREHLASVARSSNGHVRHSQHVRDVIESRVRLTIFADEASAVHREHHGQRLNRAVVDDVVVAALQERGIDGDDGPQSAR